MSVLGCAKVGCHSIMCDTYVDGVGYVCNQCQEEFKRDTSQDEQRKLNKQEIAFKLETWLQIEKDEDMSYDMYKDIDSYFREYKHNNR